MLFSSRHVSSVVITALATLGCVAPSLVPAHASALIQAGSLIKASTPAVYYVAANGKRYGFPDLATYQTWYNDFSVVQTVSDQDLAAIGLGGMVTMKPGVRMVKIATDPKVYAVGRGGALHWVATEALATALYGATWNKQINDVPDAFFTNYHPDTALATSTDFVPTNEQTASRTIELDLAARAAAFAPTLTPPTATPSVPSAPVATTTPITTPSSTIATIAGRLDVLTPGDTHLPGDLVTVLASVSSGLIDRANVFFDSTSSPAACTSFPCHADFTMPNVQSTTTMNIVAVFQAGHAAYTTSTASVTIVPNIQSNLIRITAPTRVTYGSNRDIQADVDNGLAARSIKLLVDNTIVKECLSTQFCQYTQEESAPAGSTRSVSAIVLDANYRQIYSPISTFVVVQ